MSWRVQPTATGAVIVTNYWPDLALLPQPVFHRDEVTRLVQAKASAEHFGLVGYVKQLFRGAWVTAATGPRKPRRPRKPRPFGGYRPAPVYVEREDDDA